MNKSKTYDCYVCGKVFSQQSNLYRHKKAMHSTTIYSCSKCRFQSNRKDSYLRHIKKHLIVKNQTGGGKKVNNKDEKDNIKDVCSFKALNGTVETYIIPAEGKVKFDPMTFLKSKYEDVKNKLKKTIKEKGGIKWYLSLNIKMTRRNGDQLETAEPHFRGKCQTSLKFEDIDGGLKESIKKVFNSFIEYQRQGSNWTIDKIVDLTIHMARYRPLKGSSYIPLPTKLRSKHAIINVKNRDNKCFMWSILAALYPQKTHGERVFKYREHESKLNFKGIPFPVKMEDVTKFEKQNKMSINVFGYEKQSVSPIHITGFRFEKQINLLLISDNKKSHYCYINDLNKLLGDQHTNKRRYHYCPYCLHGFTKEQILNDHKPYCMTHGPQRTEMPKEEDKWLFYKDIRKQLKVPYVIYADFESLLMPIQGCERDPSKSSTTRSTQHVPCGFAYKVVGLNSGTSKNPVVYRGLDAADKFIDFMVTEQENIEKKFKLCEPMVMTGGDWQLFKKAANCHICTKPLGENRVRDHCHVTGKFRGAAHNDCNINYKFTGRIPVIFHNLRGYDSHLIMQAIGKVDKRLRCIPNNMEKYISFSLGCMDFIDSFQFMPSSLETLVGNLAKEGSLHFKHLKDHFGSENKKFLLRKQVYPYEYFDSGSIFIW